MPPDVTCRAGSGRWLALLVPCRHPCTTLLLDLLSLCLCTGCSNKLPPREAPTMLSEAAALREFEREWQAWMDTSPDVPREAKTVWEKYQKALRERDGNAFCSALTPESLAQFDPIARLAASGEVQNLGPQEQLFAGLIFRVHRLLRLENKQLSARTKR